MWKLMVVDYSGKVTLLGDWKEDNDWVTPWIRRNEELSYLPWTYMVKGEAVGNTYGGIIVPVTDESPPTGNMGQYWGIPKDRYFYMGAIRVEEGLNGTT